MSKGLYFLAGAAVGSTLTAIYFSLKDEPDTETRIKRTAEDLGTKLERKTEDMERWVKKLGGR